jgi:hypothetical protein
VAFLKDQNMFIYKVCERAGESIIDALATCVVSESYPDHLSILVDALIDLLNFDYLEDQLDRGHDLPLENNEAGSLIYKLLSSTFVGLNYKKPEQMAKYTKFMIHLCSVNSRFKELFILDMEDPECGIEAFRYELGDVVGDLCETVLKAIK